MLIVGNASFSAFVDAAIEKITTAGVVAVFHSVKMFPTLQITIITVTGIMLVIRARVQTGYNPKSVRLRIRS